MSKRAEGNERKLEDRPLKQQEKSMKAYLCKNKLRNKPPEITNSTSTDVTFGGAQNSSRMVAEKQGCLSIAPADKQMNKWYTQPSPLASG